MIKMAKYSDDLAEQAYTLATSVSHDFSIWQRLGINSVAVFQSVLKAANAIFLLPCGLVWMEGMTKQKTEIHFIFWSKDIFHLLPELKDSLDMFHNYTGIGRISTMIPEGHRVLTRMVTEMGFTLESTAKNIWRTTDDEIMSADVYVRLY